jgi:DNA polymerase-3 subunit alpha
MSKKKHSVMEQERKNFIYGLVDDNGNIIVPGAGKNGVSEKIANQLFDMMMDFASFAFNNPMQQPMLLLHTRQHT